MKRILLISYHFPPLDVVASKRADSFFKELPKYQMTVDVVTHDWGDKLSPNDKVFVDEVNGKGKVFFLPKPHSGPAVKGSTPGRWSKIIYKWLTGTLEVRPDLMESEKTFKHFIFNHLNISEYDLVLAIFSPAYHFRLAYEINKKFGIPYILDSRDLWNTNIDLLNKRILHKGVVKSIQYFFNRKYWKKWHDTALFFTTTTPEYKSFLSSFIKSEGYFLANGYPDRIARNQALPSRFQICYTGNLYPSQDLNPFLMALKSLSLKYPNLHIEVDVVFIGLKKSAEARVSSLFEQAGLSSFLQVMDRMPYQECLDFMCSSSLLYYPFFKQGPVVYAVKLLEYMASGVPIIGAPLDRYGETLINATESGLATSNVQELTKYIEEHYLQWKKGNRVLLPLTDSKKQFSRANQAKKLFALINQHLK